MASWRDIWPEDTRQSDKRHEFWGQGNCLGVYMGGTSPTHLYNTLELHHRLRGYFTGH
jgi:hypothetical protein